MIKVMHIISNLRPGGAETMLYRLINRMDPQHFENQVISLTDLGPLTEKMEAAHAQVRALGMKRAAPNPLLALRLLQWIRRSKPQVVHTWMYHANLVGGLAARLAGDIPVVWAIHHSALDPRIDRRRTILVSDTCAFLSRRIPARIVCCSEVSRRIHESLGYASGKLEVIPNGFDLDHFRPDPIARTSLRKELGIHAETVVIGMAAHFRPQKDHRNFVEAAKRLHSKVPNAHFLLCGMGADWQNSLLAGWIEQAKIQDVCHLLGSRPDMARIFAATDIATTSSVGGEAFPLVVGEAMACGTPCVVTDVGDSAFIVGETGRVVAPADPQGLAQAWHNLVEGGAQLRHQLGTAGRHRIMQHFSLPAIVERYQAVYSDLAQPQPGCFQGMASPTPMDPTSENSLAL